MRKNIGLERYHLPFVKPIFFVLRSGKLNFNEYSRAFV